MCHVAGAVLELLHRFRVRAPAPGLCSQFRCLAGVLCVCARSLAHARRWRACRLWGEGIPQGTGGGGGGTPRHQ
jgi:hypothetical protein